jgi:iron complex outermembrane receptor protein
MSEQWQHDFALAYVNGRDITNKESLIDIPIEFEQQNSVF